MMSSRTKQRLFWIVVVMSVVFKLWLTSNIRIAADYAPHDAGNFLDHARALVVGHWFGAYNDFTLIKQPFYPIFLAFVEQSGLPLTVAVILLDALAAVTACLAVRPLWRSPVGRSVLFVVLFFNPYSYDMWSWMSDRSQANPALALLTVACAIAVYVRRDAPLAASLRWLVALGFAFTAFWLNREDALWIAPCLIVIFAAYAYWVFTRRRPEFTVRLVSCAIPVAMCVAAVGAVMLINHHLYGWAVTNEQQAPELVSAYSSLVRIDVPKERYIPVPRAAREIAYGVSAAARELQPSLEGENGQDWINNTCAGMQELCSTHDIGGGWFIWALRDAVQNAGHYDSGTHARLFYLQLAHEIDAACDAGQIKCRRKNASVFPPPMSPADVPAVAASAGAGLRSLFGMTNLQLDGPPGTAPVSPLLRLQLELEYDFIARSVYQPANHQFRGWMIYDPSTPAVVDGPGSAESQLIFSASPDVARAFQHDRTLPAAGMATARFVLATNCDQSCVFIVRGAGNSVVRVPLADNVIDFTAPGVRYHLDAAREINEFDKGFKNRLMDEAGQIYRVLFAPVLLACIVLTLLRIRRAVRLRRFAAVAPGVVLVVGVGAAVAALMLILSIMDALAFHAFVAVYLGGAVALLLYASVFTVAADVVVLGRFLRRYRAHAEGSPRVL